MKKFFKSPMIGILLFFFFQMSFAQPGERFEAWKVAYYTQKLNLTPDEAKLFWPVYNQFSGDRKKIRDKMRLERMEMKINFEEMKDEEVEALLDEMVAGRQSELDLYKRYINEFRKVLPPKKVALLMRVEQNFKQEVLRAMSDQPQRPGPKGRPQGNTN